MEEKRKEKEDYKSSFADPNPPQRKLRFFNDDGKAMNINQANVDFSLLEDDDDGGYVLDVACYKHLGEWCVKKSWKVRHMRILPFFLISYICF